MPWYDGPTLLYHLEHVVIASDRNLVDVRFPVQWVIRPKSDEHHDYRGYAGPGRRRRAPSRRRGASCCRAASGPGSRRSTPRRRARAAFPPMSVTLRLDDDVDVSRGDMIVGPTIRPIAARELDAMICWMGEQPLRPGGRYAIKHTTRTRARDRRRARVPARRQHARARARRRSSRSTTSAAFGCARARRSSSTRTRATARPGRSS